MYVGRGVCATASERASPVRSSGLVDREVAGVCDTDIDREPLVTARVRDPLLLRNLIQTDELDANSKAACLRWRAPGEGGAGRVCGAVATRTGPTTLARFARWVD